MAKTTYLLKHDQHFGRLYVRNYEKLPPGHTIDDAVDLLMQIDKESGYYRKHDFEERMYRTLAGLAIVGFFREAE